MGGARFLQCISRLLEPLANCPFGGLCTMLDCLARFFCRFLNGCPSFFYWTLILGSHRERYAE
jgi:hypothetical protein